MLSDAQAPEDSLKNFLAHFLTRQFGVFLIVGGLSAAVNFLSGAAIRLVSTSGVVYAISIVVGMFTGSVMSFFLNRRFTFKVDDEPAGPQALRFALASVGAIFLGWAFAEVLFAIWVALGSPWLSRASGESAAHIGAIGLNTLYSFVAMKFFALRRRAHPVEAAPKA